MFVSMVFVAFVPPVVCVFFFRDCVLVFFG